MLHFRWIEVSVVCTSLILCLSAESLAAVTPAGDTILGTTTIVGKNAPGTLRIDGGSVFTRAFGNIGYYSTSTGAVTVTGPGSQWVNTDYLRIGVGGVGTLTIEAGALVSSKSGHLGDGTVSSGTVTVTGAGSQWNNSYELYVGWFGPGTLNVSDGGQITTGTLYSPMTGLFGNGTITTKGAVLDANLVFDSTHGLNQSLAFGSGGSINLTADGTGDLGVGYKDNGTLRIADGMVVTSKSGYLCFGPGSTAAAVVSGAGTKWTTSNLLQVGRYGGGTLTIEAGAEVTTGLGNVGSYSGASSSALVTGTGSKWTLSSLRIGSSSASGSLTVANGGLVTVRTLAASPADLFGNGTINANGVDLDADLLFDSTHGTTQVLSFGSGGILNLNVNGIGELGAGHRGVGSLRIADGVAVSSVGGYLGNFTGSVGSAVITGSGSKWTSSSDLSVGYMGSGSLTIDAGGQFIGSVKIGVYEASTGTMVVTGAGSLLSGNVTVGSDGNGTLLIKDGGQVTGSGGTIAQRRTSTGTVTVTGAGSKWIVSGRLICGPAGSASITVSDGGIASAQTLWGSRSNLNGNGTVSAKGVLIDEDLVFDATHGTTQSLPFGTGGVLNLTIDGSGELGAGYWGAGSLQIAGGVTIGSTSGYLGYYAGSSGTATISGPGTKWTGSGSLNVGVDGNGALRIESAGQMTAESVRMADDVASTGTATIAGAGSSCTSDNSIAVGYYGMASFNIEAGGQVSDRYGYIGQGSTSIGIATVTGTGSKWVNSQDLHVGSGGYGTLKIEAGGQVSNAGFAYIGKDAYSTGVATITGAGSTWSTSGTLYVGYSGNGTLTASNGASVSCNSSAVLGYSVGATGSATVSGTGSTWTITTDLFVGLSGTGTLTVDNGGQVTAKTIYASWPDLYGNGTITANGAVADTGLTFDGAHPLNQTINFGTGGAFNLTINGTGALGAGYKGNGTLRIADGLVVSSTTGYVGFSAGSSGAATVTGTGSRWANSSPLYVARDGAGILAVQAGGQVSNTTGYVGYSTGSTGAVTVVGAGSAWSNTGILYVGYSGIGTMTISDGAAVSNSTGQLGYNTGSFGTVTVTGSGSTWTNTGDLYVGRSGGGKLTVADAASVSALALYGTVGDLSGNGTIATRGAVIDANLVFNNSGGNMAVVPFGSGGNLSVTASGTGALGAGYKGTGLLQVAGGAVVASTSGYLGYFAGADGAAVVTGAGSKWTNSSDLAVGYSGNGSMNVEGGASVSNNFGQIAYNAGATGTVTVTGSGSKWTSSRDLRIGYSGSGSMIINDGALVSDQNGYIGMNAGATGTVAVSGTGAMWNNTSSNGCVSVGGSGTGTLAIRSGGQVMDYLGYIGQASGATGLVTVSGAGSIWTNSSTLAVGSSGRGTLILADGGKITATGMGVNSQSSVKILVSNSDMLVLGKPTTNATLNNNGVIGFYADALLPAGVYQPISTYAGRTLSWGGTGSYYAVGGTWDSVAKTFTVNPPTTLFAGAADPVISGERLLITDSVSGKCVGASFGTITGTSTFSASPMPASETDALIALLTPDKQILGAWDFSTDIPSGSEILLSYELGRGLDADSLAIWHLDHGVWSPCTPSMFRYDSNGIAAFSATSFSGYAVVVPEPSALGLVLFGFMMMGFRGRHSASGAAVSEKAALPRRGADLSISCGTAMQ